MIQQDNFRAMLLNLGFSEQKQIFSKFIADSDHCGILRVKTDEIEPEYVAWALKQEGARVNFTRSYRASIDRVSGLTLDLPPQEVQMQLVQDLKESKRNIAQAQRIIDQAPAQKQAILKQYL